VLIVEIMENLEGALEKVWVEVGEVEKLRKLY